MNININIIPDSVIIFDHKENIIDINEKALLETGYTNKKVKAIKLNSILPQLSKKIQDGNFASIINEQKSLIFDSILISRNKEKSNIQIAISKCSENKEYYIAIFKKVNIEVENNIQTELESLIDSLGFGVIVINMDKTILNINKYAFDFMGYDSEDKVKGEKCCDVFCHINEEFCPVFSKEFNNSQIEREIVKKNGEKVPVLVDSRVISFRGETVVLESFIDISPMKDAKLELESHRLRLENTITERTNSLEKQREHLEKSQKALSYLLEDMDEAREELLIANQYMRAANQELESFSYSVSHDLRSPLTRMDGFSKALLELYGDKLDEKGLHYLKRIRASSQNMADLINDLLTLSRITRAEINKQKIDISQICDKIIDEIVETNKSRKVSFIVEDNLTDFGDKTLIKSLLENLIGNAFKFTVNNKNAKIEIGKTLKNDSEFFFIKDNGVGFDMKYYNKLFAVFQRLHSTEEFPGTGIGLASVQRIINKHNGQIFAESELNVGTTFYFNMNV